MMKKFFTILLTLFAVISMAMAQPAKIDKGNVDNSTQVDTLSACQEVRDDLYVEILATDDPYNIGGYHFPNDSSLLCPMGWMYFVTNYNNGSYWHTWETSLGPDEYIAFGPNDSFIFILLDTSCYIKVTVTDDDGNTGTDSIYFNIKNGIDTPDNFEMEIIEVNGTLNAKFNFMPSSGTWFFGTYVSQTGIIPADEGWIYYNGTQLYEGSYVDNFIIHYYNYNENTVWNVLTYILDTCGQTRYDVFPGMYLGTENSNDNHFLKFKTSLQSGDHDEYVYTIFTVDSNGIRYPFIVDDEQVILPSNTINYELPIPHEHPYYQCAVLGITDSGDYKILSYSNKVANPWLCTALHMETMEDGDLFDYCLAQGDTMDVVVYGAPNCPTQYWEWESNGGTVVLTGNAVVFANSHETQSWDVVYHGCDREVPFRVMFYESDWEDPFTDHVLWKRQGETIHLDTVEISNPGTCSVTFSAHGCSDTYTGEVRDNVEILNATVDLQTGKDKVIWQTTPEQAGYIDKVKVVRYDGSAYSVPYTQGYYLFSGTENVARNYHVVAVTKEGEECPLASYEKGTVHTDYTVEAGELRMAWNVPYVEPGAVDELTGFQICKYDPATQEVTVIERLDAAVTEYNVSADLCADGKVVVAAVFNHDEERRSFSNSFTTLAVDEHETDGFKVYPNPSNGSFTVEGTGHLTVLNLLGQQILIREIEEKTTLELPQGIYFMRLGSVTRKVVVE